MDTFEYRIVSDLIHYGDNERILNKLNELGKEGWELVHVDGDGRVKDTLQCNFWLKRKIVKTNN